MEETRRVEGDGARRHRDCDGRGGIGFVIGAAAIIGMVAPGLDLERQRGRERHYELYAMESEKGGGRGAVRVRPQGELDHRVTKGEKKE